MHFPTKFKRVINFGKSPYCPFASFRGAALFRTRLALFGQAGCVRVCRLLEQEQTKGGSKAKKLRSV